jgi:hypothetical protein
MNAKDLERLFAKHGANPSGFAVVVQKLREAFKVSVRGRGFNAHDLTADEMALISATYVGSDVPARASETLDRLIKLRALDPVSENYSGPKDFIACFQLILLRDSLIPKVREIRIARNADFAEVIFHKGASLWFANRRKPGAVPPAFRSEGVISATLIDLLAKNVFVPEQDGGPLIEADDE